MSEDRLFDAEYNPAELDQWLNWLENERILYLRKEIRFHEELYYNSPAFASYQLAVLHAKLDEAKQILDRFYGQYDGEDGN